MSDRLLYIFSAQSPLALADPTGGTEATDEPKLLWKVIFRTGEWKLRPGPGGVKLKEPLKIFRDKAPKGHLSMTAIKANFEADPPAKENVTIPVVHADGTTSDSGFVRKLVIQDIEAPSEDGSKKKIKSSLLWAGVEITDSEISRKVAEKSLIGCSAGVLFDYERTEDGQKFDQVLSHMMLTNSPWINGCGGFHDKLPDGVMASEDVKLDQDEIALEAESATKTIENTPVWKAEDGFQWMRGKVQKALDRWRRSITASLPRDSYSYEDFPYMSVEDVSGAEDARRALVSSGYGDSRETWVAGFKLEDGDVVIDAFTTWTEAKQEWVAASEDTTIQTSKPIDQKKAIAALSAPVKIEMSELQKAQAARDEARGTSLTSQPGGSNSMSKLSELFAGVQLSDEQSAALARHEQEEANRERELKDAREATQKSNATSFLSEMDTIDLGQTADGKDVEFPPGVKVAVKNILMSDDGGTAINLSEVTESGAKTQPVALSATDVVKKVFEAFPRKKATDANLSEQARALPGDKKPPEGKEPGLSEDKRSPSERARAWLSDDDGVLASELNISIPKAGGGS